MYRALGKSCFSIPFVSSDSKSRPGNDYSRLPGFYVCPANRCKISTVIYRQDFKLDCCRIEKKN